MFPWPREPCPSLVSPRRPHRLRPLLQHFEALTAADHDHGDGDGARRRVGDDVRSFPPNGRRSMVSPEEATGPSKWNERMSRSRCGCSHEKFTKSHETGVSFHCFHFGAPSDDPHSFGPGCKKLGLLGGIEANIHQKQVEATTHQ